MTAFSDLAPDDQQAIGKTLLTLLAGYSERDAEALRAVYSDDADWVNAFGAVKRGREKSSTTCGACSLMTTSTAANPFWCQHTCESKVRDWLAAARSTGTTSRFAHRSVRPTGPG